MIPFELPVETPAQALVAVETSRYGFSLFDLGVDLSPFDNLRISCTDHYNRFGELEKIEVEVAQFLANIGPNSEETVCQAAAKVNEIVQRIMKECQKETAWVCLRATHPDENAESSRWHMDASHYRNEGSAEYKFLTTLIGPSTRFYPMSNQWVHFRSLIWEHMMNSRLMEEICQPDQVVEQKRGQGAFMIVGDRKRAALHSVPPLKEVRLFMSILPCSSRQVQQVKLSVR